MVSSGPYSTLWMIRLTVRAAPRGMASIWQPSQTPSRSDARPWQPGVLHMQPVVIVDPCEAAGP
jgi:hypothetical protein